MGLAGPGYRHVLASQFPDSDLVPDPTVHQLRTAIAIYFDHAMPPWYYAVTLTCAALLLAITLIASFVVAKKLVYGEFWILRREKGLVIPNAWLCFGIIEGAFCVTWAIYPVIEYCGYERKLGATAVSLAFFWGLPWALLWFGAWTATWGLIWAVPSRFVGRAGHLATDAATTACNAVFVLVPLAVIAAIGPLAVKAGMAFAASYRAWNRWDHAMRMLDPNEAATPEQIAEGVERWRVHTEAIWWMCVTWYAWAGVAVLHLLFHTTLGGRCIIEVRPALQKHIRRLKRAQSIAAGDTMLALERRRNLAVAASSSSSSSNDAAAAADVAVPRLAGNVAAGVDVADVERDVAPAVSPSREPSLDKITTTTTTSLARSSSYPPRSPWLNGANHTQPAGLGASTERDASTTPISTTISAVRTGEGGDRRGSRGGTHGRGTNGLSGHDAGTETTFYPALRRADGARDKIHELQMALRNLLFYFVAVVVGDAPCIAVALFEASCLQQAFFRGGEAVTHRCVVSNMIITVGLTLASFPVAITVAQRDFEPVILSWRQHQRLIHPQGGVDSVDRQSGTESGGDSRSDGHDDGGVRFERAHGRRKGLGRAEIARAVVPPLSAPCDGRVQTPASTSTTCPTSEKPCG